MDRNKYFFNNTFILLLGKFSTQFMSLLMLPIFTRFLLTEDFGIVDLMQTYMSLLLPILTLRIDSAIFRFLIEDNNDREKVTYTLTNSFFILLLGLTATILLATIIYFFYELKYYPFVVINLIIMMCSSCLLQVLRGFRLNKDYAMVSVISGTVTILSNGILIIVLNFNASAILISSSIANLICIIYIFNKLDVKRFVNIKKINKIHLKKILYYSVPMIPNALSWWIVNVSDRTIIFYFLGSASNAIYSVSCKFSNILNSVFSVFNMSWQEMASLHINDSDRDSYFSEMINSIFFFFCSVCLGILTLLPFIFNIVIGTDYANSYQYIPILLFSNIWNVLIGLLGSVYIALKKTKEIAITTFLSASINLVLNFIFIRYVGIYAACFSTLISYFLMCIYRLIDCRRIILIKISVMRLLFFSLCYLIATLSYFNSNLIIHSCSLILSIVYFIIINFKFLSSYFNNCSKKGDLS